jgi:hypothetical protein
MEKLMGTTSDLFEKFKCTECSSAIRDAFQKAGLRGEVVRIENVTGRNIYHDDFGVIGESGFHEGVRVGNRVYDNLHGVNGVPIDEWMRKVGVGEQSLLRVRVVDEF